MKKNILREIFSGANGKLSAKRVIGGVAMAVALGCTIALVIRDGSNSVVENLLMTIFISSISLIGLPAVTGVWGGHRMSIGKNAPQVYNGYPNEMYDRYGQYNQQYGYYNQQYGQYDQYGGSMMNYNNYPTPPLNQGYPDCSNCIYKQQSMGYEKKEP